jgi:hypothetical protein
LKGAGQEEDRHADDSEPDNAEQDPENDRRHRLRATRGALKLSRCSWTSPAWARLFAREGRATLRG